MKKENCNMAWTCEVWIICMLYLYLARLAIPGAEGSNATTIKTTTTTESSGTITLPVWIIYALVFPIIGIAALIGLVALCRWILRKRHLSVLPNNEPDKHRIVNDLKKENEDDKKVLDRFVVSYESNKTSQKPKKAVNCLNKRAQMPSNAEESRNGIERLNKALELAKEEREMIEQNMQDDAISENAFNHLKEETSPKVNALSLRNDRFTSRSESMINTFKVENENGDKSYIPRAVITPNRRVKKQRKPKVSALKRNTKLLKSKLNRQTADSSDETTDVVTEISTSTVFTESEESEIDPSFAQSGEEDFITDDEDSGSDNFNLRYPKGKKMSKRISNETPVEYLSKPAVTQQKVHRSQSTNKKATEKKIKLQTMTLGDNHVNESQKKLSRSKSSAAKLKSEHSSDSHHKQKNKISSPISDVKQKTANKESQNIHLPRQGPIATSSFKSNADGKSDTLKGENKQKQVNVVKEESKYHDVDTERLSTVKVDNIDRHERNDSIFYDNYKQFEEMVMYRGKVNLNRSMSLNEADRYKDDISSRRRKRKYQSLRQAKKESVFDAVQTLDKAPKKSILKKSKSLHVRNVAAGHLVEIRMSCKSVKEETVSSCQKKACPNAQLTINGDLHNSDEHNEFRALEENRNIITDNKSDVSRTGSLKLQTRKKETDLPQRSITPDPFVELDMKSDKANTYFAYTEELSSVPELKKQKRNQLFETKSKGSVAVVSPNTHNDGSVDENACKPAIMSSNLDSASKNISTPEMTKFNFSKSSTKDTDETKSSTETFSFGGLSPILSKEVVNEPTSLQEAETKSSSHQLGTNLDSANGSSFSEPGSELVVISSDTVKFDAGLQAKMRNKLIVHQQENCKVMKPSNDVDLTEMTTEKIKTLPTKETFQIKAKHAFEEEDSNKSVKLEKQNKCEIYDTMHGHDKVFQKHEWHMNETHQASIHVSERGLVYSRDQETGYSHSQLFNTHTHNADLLQHAEKDQFTDSMVTDSKSKSYHNDRQATEQSSFTVADYNTPSQKTMRVETQLTDMHQQNKGAGTQLNDIKTPCHLLHNDGEYAPESIKDERQKTRSFQNKHKNTPLPDSSDTSTLTGESPKIINYKDKFKTTSPHQNKRQNFLPSFVEQTENTVSRNASSPLPMAEGLETPNHNRRSRLSLVDHREIQRRASVISTISKICSDDKLRPMTPSERPKSADIFSGRPTLPGIEQSLEITERNKDYVRVTNMKHDKEESNEHKKDTGRRHMYVMQRTEALTPRSKSPALDIDRSVKYVLDSKRSKTPTPVPTYRKSNTDDSFMNTLVTESKPKHHMLPLSKLKHTPTSHIESFSRNFPTASKDNGRSQFDDHSRNLYRTSLRNKAANTWSFEKQRSDTRTLLTRREKEDNTLNDRVNSRKPSARDRPKSAMSLRSASRPTYLETVHAIPRSSKGRTNKQTRHSPVEFGKERSFSESFHFSYTNPIQHGDILNMNKRHKVNLQPGKLDLTDSDSEIEQFFANPDAEVLRLESPDDINDSFVKDCGNTLSAYTNRSKLSKSISFKM